MLDIHTHYDVEVLDGPRSSESLRHGVTTVMLGSCSLSTVHVDGVDAGDLFGRVEAIPREHVIGAVDEHKTWTNCEEYVAALEALPLGPNLAAFIGHSDMRAATMGLDRATRKDVSARPSASRPRWSGCSPRRSTPASSECPRSSCCSTSSTVRSAARAPCPRRTPSRANCAGSSRCCGARGRVLQSGPDIENPLNLGSAGGPVAGLFRKPLKTSLLSAADVKANPYADQDAWARRRGWSTGSAATSAGSTCRCRSRSTPTASTW